MKKTLVMILLVSMILTGFAGCSNENITPTDISSVNTTPDTVTEVVSQGVPSDETGQTVQESEVQTDDVDSTAESPQVSSKTNTERRDDEAVKPSNTTSVASAPVDHSDFGDDIAVDEGVPSATFYDEASLKNWLLTGGSSVQRDQVLSDIMSGNTITYPRLSIPADNTLISLKQLRVDEHSVWTYTYRFIGDADGATTANREEKRIVVNIRSKKSSVLEELFNGYKSGTLTSPEISNVQVCVVNGIEYVCVISDSKEFVLVYWQQNGIYHSVHLYGHLDQLDDVLELLVVEQVTLRTDTVTQ